MTYNGELIFVAPQLPTPNLMLGFGDTLQGYTGVVFSLVARKSIANRIKFWFLCKILPFHIMRWDK